MRCFSLLFLLEVFCASFSPSLIGQSIIEGVYDSRKEVFSPENKAYQVKVFREGLAVFSFSGMYGVIDTAGTIICESKYSEIEGFSGGVSLVSNYKVGYRYFGFIDRQGNELVPVIYDYADYRFDRALRMPGVLLLRKNNLYTAYSLDGEVLIPERYSSINSFVNQRALVFRDGAYGFLNKSWEEIIPAIYEEAQAFSGGKALVKKEGLWGIIDTSGNTVLGFQYESIQDYGPAEILKVKSKGLFGLISESGQEVLPPIYEALHNLKEARIAAKIAGKYGYINLNGEWLIEPKYDWLGDFSEGRAIAKFNGKWGHIDTLNQIITPFIYDKTGPFNQGIAYVQSGDLFGKINLSGELFIPVKYHGIGHFKNGLAPVVIREDGKKYRGMIDTRGKEVIPCLYLEIRDLKEGMRAVRDEYWGYLNEAGQLAIPCVYQQASDFSGGKAQVYKDGETYQIDKKGNRIE